MKDRSKSYSALEKTLTKVQLTSELIEGFVETYILDRLPRAYPVPDFHRELWNIECNPHPFVAVAAPRGHAKSTAGNYIFIIANQLFGQSDFALLVASSESRGREHLRNLRNLIVDNPSITEDFEVEVLKDNADEFWYMTHGRLCMVLAVSAEQKIRGVNINNRRPDLILCDDMEDDEMVSNPERRKAFRGWFKNVIIPIGNEQARYRVLGTILHLDAFLERLLNSKSWLSVRFRAHADFDDFSEILWPERFTEDKLKMLRQAFIDDMDTVGYCQEYLCWPISQSDAYFKEAMFEEMDGEDYNKPKLYYSAVDFAISETEHSDFTAIVTAGMDNDGLLHVIDVRTIQTDGPEIIEALFEVQKRWRPEIFIFENGQISKSLGGFLRQEIFKRAKVDPELLINYITVTPTRSKEVRAKSIQKRMQMGGVKFDKEADWYETFHTELTQFPRGKHDDQVDATAYIGLFLDQLIEAPSQSELEQQEWEEEMAESLEFNDGRSDVTGY